MTARVRGLRTARIVFAVMVCESWSTSATTGIAPRIKTQLADAMKVRLGTITSSPGPMPSTCKASSNATVPLPSATACLQPVNAANSFFELPAFLARPIIHPAGFENSRGRFYFLMRKIRPGGERGFAKRFAPLNRQACWSVACHLHRNHNYLPALSRPAGDHDNAELISLRLKERQFSY